MVWVGHGFRRAAQSRLSFGHSADRMHPPQRPAKVKGTPYPSALCGNEAEVENELPKQNRGEVFLRVYVPSALKWCSI